MEIAKRRVRRVAIAVAGGAVLLVGVIAIPYPGPGWLIVFTGLAILATEFTWARRALTFVKYRYDLWSAWLKRRHPVVRIAVLAGTGLIVVLTLWLLNVFGLLAGVFNISADWAKSPFVN